MTSSDNLSDHIEAIARFVLGGDPNPTHSSKSQWRFGSNGSLAIELSGSRRGCWCDFERGEGGGPWELLRRKLDDKDVAGWLARNLGIHLEPAAGGHVADIYPYRDESGRLLFEVVRLVPKRFLQRRPNGEWGIKGVRRVLYRLPELVAAPKDTIVYITEGEKDCDRLIGLWGLTATTNPMDAGKWHNEYNKCLRGRHIVILPDNDEAGHQHAVAAATSLLPVAASVRVLHLSRLPSKADISDWIAAGGTQSDLLELVEATPLFHTDDPDTDDEPENVVELIRGSSRTPIPVSWLWNGYLARGKLHLLAGVKGAGKTTIALSIAAAFTTGGLLPDGTRAPIGDVLMWSGEDDFDDGILPRLIACGGDPDRFHFVGDVTQRKGKKRPFDPASDLPALIAAAQHLPALVLNIIDPVVSVVYVGGDSHKNAETRRSMQPLRDLVRATKAAELGITHFTKGSKGQDPLERVTGSLAFGALPRVVLAAARPRDPEAHKRRFVRVASNIGEDTGGFEYGLERVLLPDFDFTAQRVEWGDELQGEARDLLDEIEADQDAQTKVEEAGDWLRERLKAGPVWAVELQADAKAAGIAWRAIERAKAANRIVAKKDGPDGTWRWRLPPKDNH